MLHSSFRRNYIDGWSDQVRARQNLDSIILLKENASALSKNERIARKENYFFSCVRFSNIKQVCFLLATATFTLLAVLFVR